MSDYRIEIVFSGPAPLDELARSKILGCAIVQEGIEKLAATLRELGFEAEVSARSIRSSEARRKSRSGPKLAAAAE